MAQPWSLLPHNNSASLSEGRGQQYAKIISLPIKRKKGTTAHEAKAKSKIVQVYSFYNYVSFLINFESDPNFAKHKGSLVVIGSGIKSVGQFTLEAVSHNIKGGVFAKEIQDC